MILPFHIYAEAEEEGIGVHFTRFEQACSLSVPDQIAMDCSKLPTCEEESTAAAHELGHVLTGSFYNMYAAINIRQKLENKADRRAITRYIDQEVLMKLLSQGDTLEDISHFFGFTPQFITKAICLYQHGNLAVTEYMGGSGGRNKE